jgi:type II secretory pathway pseudopilin PulG
VCFYLKFGRRGSILLEIAIAISIIGLISGFFITKTIAAGRALRVQITKNNIETIIIALSSFVANHSRLPRPSLNDKGYENSAPETNLHNFVGRIPFGTLGIPAKITLDGNGRPLLYIVEPYLTFNFASIYEKVMENNCFCHGIPSPNIMINNIRNLLPDVVALVIDTDDNQPTISETIRVTVSKYTNWISRDRLLMQYLKNCPCKKELRRGVENSVNDDFNLI